MIVESIVIGGIVMTALPILKSMVYTVKERQEVLIESFGKYVKTTQNAGLKFKLPWPLQNVAAKVPTSLLEMKEDLATKTKDDIFVTLPIKMHLQVSDTKKFHYESNDPIKQVMSRMDFAELYQARETISDQAREKVGKEIGHLYGMSLVDVIVDEPHAPAEIQQSYNNVKASERNKLAAVNDAEADKIRTIAEAEARKEALRLDGEGIAAQRKAIFENYAEQFNKLASHTSEDFARDITKLAMTNDTIRDAAKHGNTIITTTGTAQDPLAQMRAVMDNMTRDESKAAANANDPATGAQKPPATGM